MRAGDIFLARFPFGDLPGMKLRPVLLLTTPLGPVPEVVSAYITSVVPPLLLPSDIVIDPAAPQSQATGLKVVSTLRLHKLASLHTSSLVRFLGAMDAQEFSLVRIRLRTLFNI
jgi:mRNA interferase MazF